MTLADHFLFVCVLILVSLWWPKALKDLGMNFSWECVALYIKLLVDVRLCHNNYLKFPKFRF